MLENSKFTKIDEEFICENCGRKVTKLNYTCRNHCPYCLHSKHVDINPGDRAENCHGVFRTNRIRNKFQKGYVIVFKCKKCGAIRKKIKLLKMIGQIDTNRMKEMDAYIGIRAIPNAAELNGISKEAMELYNKHYTVPVHFQERVKNTKWCILRYPNNAMAQMAKMNKDEFENFFFFNVCNLDYRKMSKQ